MFYFHIGISFNRGFKTRSLGTILQSSGCRRPHSCASRSQAWRVKTDRSFLEIPVGMLTFLQVVTTRIMKGSKAQYLQVFVSLCSGEQIQHIPWKFGLRIGLVKEYPWCGWKRQREHHHAIYKSIRYTSLMGWKEAFHPPNSQVAPSSLKQVPWECAETGGPKAHLVVERWHRMLGQSCSLQNFSDLSGPGLGVGVLQSVVRCKDINAKCATNR